jgi:hypothetical protein
MKKELGNKERNEKNPNVARFIAGCKLWRNE